MAKSRRAPAGANVEKPFSRPTRRPWMRHQTTGYEEMVIPRI
jgi:hypothetical protein